MATESSIMDSNSFKEEYASMLSPKTREMISKREKYLGGAYRLFCRCDRGSNGDYSSS